MHARTYENGNSNRADYWVLTIFDIFYVLQRSQCIETNVRIENTVTGIHIHFFGKNFFLRSSPLISFKLSPYGWFFFYAFRLRWPHNTYRHSSQPFDAVQARTRSAHTLFFGLSTQEWSSSSTSSFNYMTNEKCEFSHQCNLHPH